VAIGFLTVTPFGDPYAQKPARRAKHLPQWLARDLQRKSNDLFIKGAGTPNVIAMREEFVKAEHHGAGPGRLVSLSYRRKIRLSAKEAKKPEYQPLTLNNRAWRRLRLPNIEKLRPHWQAIA